MDEEDEEGEEDEKDEEDEEDDEYALSHHTYTHIYVQVHLVPQHGSHLVFSQDSKFNK